MFSDRFGQDGASQSERGAKLPDASPHGGGSSSIETHVFALLSGRGETANLARASAIMRHYASLSHEPKDQFHLFLAQNLQPDARRLKTAAEAYIAAPAPETAAELARTSRSPRQELIRRLNTAPGGTAFLVGLRQAVLAGIRKQPALKPLEQDLYFLLSAWFNRGFFEFRRIDWHSSATVLQKIISYEAVHEIDGWDDLRRRLAPDRRCFAFFHSALPDEPLIFIEVALCQGMASRIEPLLATKPSAENSARPDTAIFYSISNCQPGLRDMSFGNSLITQVAETVRAELPSLKHFATLSPVPSFRRWLKTLVETDGLPPFPGEEAIANLVPAAILEADWNNPEQMNVAQKAGLQQLLAIYLTAGNSGKGPLDPVARFHLGNGARLDRINWAANLSHRCLTESLGMMVNYVYDAESIDSNQEQLLREGRVVHSAAVGELLHIGKKQNEAAPPPLVPRKPFKAVENGFARNAVR